MATEDTIDVTLQDLRAIIHGLKMSNFSFVEPDALENINYMIQALPGPEELNSLGEFPNAIKDVQKNVGGIMRLIETYGRRDPESKSRYKARTDLPPRYPVLAWENKMKSQAKEVIKKLVIASASVDKKGGHGKIAEHLIKCAKKVQSNDLMERDIDKAVDFLKEAGFDKEADMFLEAQVGQYMKSLWDTGKQMGSQLAHKFLDPARLQKTKAKLTNVIQVLKEEMQYGLDVASKSQDPAMTAKVKSLVDSMGQMSTAGNQALTILQQVEQSEQAQQAQQAQGQEAAAAQAIGQAGAPAAAPAAAPTGDQTINGLKSMLENPSLNVDTYQAIQKVIDDMQASVGGSVPSAKTPVAPNALDRAKKRNLVTEPTG